MFIWPQLAKTPLGEPTDLKDALERIGQHGHLHPIVDNPPTCLPPVLARNTSHVLSIVATVPFSGFVYPRQTISPSTF